MNTDNDQLETILGSKLHDRAGAVSGSPLTFHDVRGRATSIRRRRLAGAGIGLVAAVAVIAPFAISSTGLMDTKGPDQPVAPAPTQVVRAALTLDGLQRGDDPAIEYFTGDGVVLPDTGLQRLPTSLQALVPSELDGWWLALSPGRDEVLTLGPGFDQVSAQAIGQNFVSGPDRSAVAWTEVEGNRQTLTMHSTTADDDDAVWDFPRTPQVDPVDFAGGGSLLFQTTNRADGTHEMGIASEDGTTSLFEGDFVQAIAASPVTGLVAVQTSSDSEAAGCFGVVDPSSTTARTVWETCAYSLGAFSPDGRYVLASDPYLSGLGPTSVSVLEAETGDLVTTFQPGRGTPITLMGLVWESSGSILAMTNDGSDNTLLRLGVDGTIEETVEPIPDDPMADVPFYLGSDRRRGAF